MSGHTNLVRRGATYYYRARVPEDLQQHYRRREFFVSLKTRNRLQAEQSLIRLKARLLDDFTALRGGDQTLPALPPLVKSPSLSLPVPAKVSLWSLVEYWSNQAERRPRTLMEVNTAFKRLIACNGNLSPSEVEKRHIVAYKDWMLEQGRSAATIKKSIGLLSTVFELAVANDKMSVNVTRGIRLAKPKVEKKSRIPFDSSDLGRIFTSPVFSQAERPRGGKGEAAYWLPYLGLWTGARLEELGQLLVADVCCEQAMHYLNISDDPLTGKKLKSNSSRRRVPIHPELVRLGFLDYVRQQVDAGHAHLFPLLSSAAGRQLTASWSQWFSRYLRNTVGIKDRRKVFHSFRHGFKEACRLSGIPKDVHDQLTGHASRDVGDRYGGEQYPLRPLVAAIESLRYVGYLSSTVQ